MTRRPDGGAAAVWVLVCAAALAAVAAAVVLRTLAVLARHRVESAADLAALAAATRIGIGGDPCAVAREIAAANSVRVTGCRLRIAPGGRSGTVVVTVSSRVSIPLVGALVVDAGARAARLPPGARAGA